PYPIGLTLNPVCPSGRGCIGPAPVKASDEVGNAVTMYLTIVLEMSIFRMTSTGVRPGMVWPHAATTPRLLVRYASNEPFARVAQRRRDGASSRLRRRETAPTHP